MCGVAGFFLTQHSALPPPGDAGALVRAMCDQIIHRGPDDYGHYTSGGLAIGMRRLSIIDLSTGHQPIANEDETVWVVFNGEIYNYQTLRADLVAKGHRFRTQSDTEVLVHLYEEYGLDGLTRLQGMFAIALWDGRQRELLLARDRFGKKPLYYSLQPGGLYFGSELKCFRPARLPLDLNADALRLYLQFTYVPEPHSIFRQAGKVAPGGWLRFSDTGEMKTGRYWTLPEPGTQEPLRMNEAEAQEELRARFDHAVKTRMVADVPLGAFLSGGIDSSAVVSSLALASPRPVKTFSIGFEEARFNELPHAEAVARKFGTEHHTLIVRPDSLQLIPQLVHHFDEPFADSSAIPTFLVSQFAATEVKVVLTGDGGDEIFCGYDSLFQIERHRRWNVLPQPARRMLTGLSSLLPDGAFGKNFLHGIGRRTPLERYFEFNYSLHWIAHKLLQPEWRLPLDDQTIRNSFPGCLPHNPQADILDQAIFFEATAKLTGDMLVKVDRMSMANSIEVRCPMLDHDLVEFALRLPVSWKMRAGQGKYCLIQALRDRLPETVWNRPKQGFSVPIADWFRGPLKDFLRDHLLSRRCRERGVADPVYLKQLIDEHQSGRRNHRTILWSILMLELWFEAWGQGTPAAS